MSSGWIQAIWIAGCLSNRVGAHTLSRRSRRNRHGAKIAMRALRVRGRQGGETVMVSSSEREPEPATTMTNVVRVLKQESRFLEERLLDLEQRLTNRKERERRTRAQHGWPVLARVRTGMRLPGCQGSNRNAITGMRSPTGKWIDFLERQEWSSGGLDFFVADQIVLADQSFHRHGLSL